MYYVWKDFANIIEVSSIDHQRYKAIGTDSNQNTIYADRSVLSESVLPDSVSLFGDASKTFILRSVYVKEFLKGATIFVSTNDTFCIYENGIFCTRYNCIELNCTELIQKSISAEHFVHLMCYVFGRRLRMKYANYTMCIFSKIYNNVVQRSGNFFNAFYHFYKEKYK